MFGKAQKVWNTAGYPHLILALGGLVFAVGGCADDTDALLALKQATAPQAVAELAVMLADTCRSSEFVERGLRGSGSAMPME